MGRRVLDGGGRVEERKLLTFGWSPWEQIGKGPVSEASGKQRHTQKQREREKEHIIIFQHWWGGPVTKFCMDIIKLKGSDSDPFTTDTNGFFPGIIIIIIIIIFSYIRNKMFLK